MTRAKITFVGGGPAGLYAAILAKQRFPDCSPTVLERNARDDTFGWGVVFSDATLENLAAADAPTHRAITQAFYRWDDIEIHRDGQTVVSGGHGFAGIARRRLLQILTERAIELGVDVRFNAAVDDIATLRTQCDLLVGSDGVNSRVRAAFTEVFNPDLDRRRCRFVWLGTTLPLDAFTFLFEQTQHGWFTVHAYRFDDRTSTFIV
jgi:anthraniloyl-CoA monooxygenase